MLFSYNKKWITNAKVDYKVSFFDNIDDIVSIVDTFK